MTQPALLPTLECKKSEYLSISYNLMPRWQSWQPTQTETVRVT